MDCKDVGIRKSEFVAKTQFLCTITGIILVQSSKYPLYNNSKYEIYLGRNLILNFRRKREKEKLKKHRRNEEFKVKIFGKNTLLKV